jgi:hypothetical protein
MAYQVNKFNGTLITTVEDGTIDSTTDLRFIGKNYAGYGEVQNENFLHLMENFANSTQPPKAVVGQVWYDTTNKKLRFFDGNDFKFANGATVAETAPSGLSVGEFWWDRNAQQLYTYTGTEFVLVGPEASPELGTSLVSSFVIRDVDNINHTILKLIAGGTCIAVINQDNEFSVTSSEQVRAGLPSGKFPTIKKGFTLVDTNSSGVSQNDHVVWGTSSNALRLGGVLASQFVQRGDNSFTEIVSFSDSGYTLGNDSNLKVSVGTGEQVLIEHQSGGEIRVRITTPGPSTSTTDDVAIFYKNINDQGIAPGGNLQYSLGTTGLRWENVFAGTVTATSVVAALTGPSTGTHTGNVVAASDSQILINATNKEIGYNGATIRGTLFGNVQGNVSGTADDATTLSGKSSSTSATPDTIVRRDGSGNVTAVRFTGIADKADQLLVGASYRSTSLAADANTIATRDVAGDLYAVLFRGTATSARYADLAEKYLADAEYVVGTVVVVGGSAEVTASSWGQHAIGVVSANPAYMMNSELEGGTYIALKGRVPVRIIGAVQKGDQLVAAADGCATVGGPLNESKVFAIALEDNADTAEKLVEAVVL